MWPTSNRPALRTCRRISAVLLVKGEVRIATDLGQARFESVDGANKAAVLILDPPTVSTAAIDHVRTRLFAVTEQGCG